MERNDRVVSLTELESHSTNKSCWLALHGVVMDITPFLNEHPGGPDVVVSVSGRDCTQDFEDVGHTDSARRMADKYIIGKLENSETTEELRLPTTKEVHDRKKGSGRTSYYPFLVGFTALAAVGAAVFHAWAGHK